jgi:ferredoxin
MIDYSRVKLEYFDPRLVEFEDIQECGAQCASCGICRDCDICVNICPQGAIARVPLDSHEGEGNSNGDFEMIVNPELCIGCGFCAGACPCGIWTLVENEPLE